MVALDYFVATWPEVSVVQGYVPEMRDFVRGKERAGRYGYQGVQGLQAFFGYSDYNRRYLLILTGSYADECVKKINRAMDSYVSVARIDVQSTFRVENADRFIHGLKRSKRYKATRILPEEGTGTTLYVGSRASDLFCRAYNKSSELNMPPDKDGELVRIEFCLRDKYADSVFKKYRLGSLDEVFSSLVKRMFEEESALCISRHSQVQLSERDLELLQADNYDWRERRLKWLETTVAPSLRRLIAEAPWLEQRVKEILDGVYGKIYNGY